MSRTTRVVVTPVVAILAVLLVSLGVSANSDMSTNMADVVVLEPGEGVIQLVTNTTPVRYTGNSPLYVVYPDGYGFSEITLNGTQVPTFTPPGELAHHIYPVAFGTTSGTVDIWGLSGPSPDGGLWYELWQSITKTVEITTTAETVFTPFTWERFELPRVEYRFPVSGTVTLNGYFFGEGEIRDGNGDVITTTIVSGEQARQIPIITRTVSAGEMWSWKFMPHESGSSELGVWLFLEPEPPELVTVYLPLVVHSLEPLYHDVPVKGMNGIQVHSASWPASGQRETCLRLHFRGSSDPVYIESGWFFGESISGSADGTPITVPSYKDPTELATQIGPIRIGSNPGTITLCTTSSTSGTEIGIRLRYPQ
jgi:hypothetical protein